MQLERLSALEIGLKVNRGEISPVEVLNYFKDLILKKNPSINAFVYVKFSEALEVAKFQEQQLVEGAYLGPFAGVPFALKDFLPSKKGWTHSHGGVKSLIKEDPYNSAFCNAMEKAGGIAMGKTNSPAFGFRGVCDNKLYGPTHNPFNTDYNSGGSSGGSAAAVASGMVPIAEGGDAGGSIRIPAAWCNCYGFKTSVGTIPSVCRPDGWAATHPYCFNGGITKTVADAAVLLNYMGTYNPRDPLCVPGKRPDIVALRLNKKFKIAFTEDFGIFPTDPEVVDIVTKAVKRLEANGFDVDILSSKYRINRSLNELAEMWCKFLAVDSAIEIELDKQKGFDLIGQHEEELPEEFIYWVKQASKCGILDMYTFNTVRTELFDFQQDIFDEYDLIISPTTACLPVLNEKNGNTLGPEKIGSENVERLIGFAETFLFNFTGNPAASVPAGFSKNGLPVGMQIIGKRFHDQDVLVASKLFEDIQPWRDMYPNI